MSKPLPRTCHLLLPLLFLLLGCCLFGGALFAAGTDVAATEKAIAAPETVMEPAAAPAAVSRNAAPACPAADGASAEDTVPTRDPICLDCDSPLGSCTPGLRQCDSYCRQLVGFGGICHIECNCCVCPEVPWW